MTAAYLGDWQLMRSIRDADDGTTLDCAGTARLSPLDACPTAFVYDESVRFTLAGKVIRGTRRYTISAPSARRIVACFHDGSPFFSLHVGADGVGSGVHVCGPDTYTLRLNVREPATWETEWIVTGSKRLRIITRYQRPLVP
jgi:hypothetical protein